MPADLRIKRVYEPAHPDDGARVLVDRLWPRGLRKEDAALTLWLKDIAPTPELRTWFGHEPTRWQAFSRRYRDELRRTQAPVEILLQLTTRGRVTLLYAARDSEHNHARVLRDYLLDH